LTILNHPGLLPNEPGQCTLETGILIVVSREKRLSLIRHFSLAVQGDTIAWLSHLEYLTLSIERHIIL
jgi:hypothetical protein